MSKIHLLIFVVMTHFRYSCSLSAHHVLVILALFLESKPLPPTQKKLKANFPAATYRYISLDAKKPLMISQQGLYIIWCHSE
ncbi:hypothetical protein VCRA2130O400_1520001 [Vibrio crassostreae]|nr:hypothetical protein VCRA2130O400_1520001 [Vibrio crassostreae]